MSSYCVKCRRATESVGGVRAVAKNGRAYVKSKCANCGSGKSQFLKKGATGDGLFGGIPVIGKTLDKIGNTAIPLAPYALPIGARMLLGRGGVVQRRRK